MTDRELLELAAKAAGLEFDPTVQNQFGLLVVAEDASCQSDQKLWNPLTDDGDALRLAVKLEIAVEYRRDVSAAFAYNCMRNARSLEVGQNNKNLDPYAATRRAIVRAAAEIGKEKNT
jgi:hypothetical protein